MSAPEDQNKIIPFDGSSDGVPRPRFAPKGFMEFADAPPLTWIIKKVIPKAELIVIYGESGCGKSFLALNLGMAIARGLPWHGHKTKQGRVVYVCAESPAGFRGRAKAYSLRHGLEEKDVDNFQIIDEAPNFMANADPVAMAKQIGQADVIIIDTLARVTAGGDENTGQDMGPVIARCQALHRASGALVILIHHSGKDADKGSRGWSGLKAAADTEIMVEKVTNGHQARITKQKDGPDDISWSFTLPQYSIGIDEDGDEITSCVYEISDLEPSKQSQNRKLGGWQLAVITSLERLIENESNSFVLEEVLVLETLANSASPGKNERDTRKQHIRRALTTLCVAGLVQIKDGKVFK